MTEIQVTMQFEWVTCTTCGIPFMVPEYHLQAKRRYGGSIHCPNGHGVVRDNSQAADGQLADVQQQLEIALQVAGDEQVRRVEIEAALAQSVEDADIVRRERDEARDLAKRAEESYRDAEAELRELGRAAAAREEQHARELASMRELAERQRSVPAAVEVFTPPPLSDVRKELQEETSTAAVEAWRKEVKECPNCHNEFGPEPRHREHTWRKKKFCSARCQIAFNQRRAKERQEAAAAPTESATGLMVPLAVGTADENEPEPETSPPPDAVPDAEIEPAGLDAADTPEIVHPEKPPLEAPQQVSVVLVRQGPDLVIDRSECLPPETPPDATFVVNGEPIVHVASAPAASPSRPTPLPVSEQRRLPDPRPSAGWQPVVVGETIERLDNGNCPDCGTPLNAFKVCPTCKLRNRRTSGRAFGT